MSAYGEGLDVVLGVAAVDLSSYQYCPVKLISTGVDICDAATDPVAGILQNAPTAGQSAVVRVHGMSKVKAGDTIAIGDKLRPEVTTGRAVAEAADGLSDNDKFIFGVACAAAADGELFEALIQPVGYNQYPVTTIT
jgi:hypothetical protein